MSRLARAAQLLDQGLPILTIQRETQLTTHQIRYVEQHGPPRNAYDGIPGPRPKSYPPTAIAPARHALEDWIDDNG